MILHQPTNGERRFCCEDKEQEDRQKDVENSDGEQQEKQTDQPDDGIHEIRLMGDLLLDLLGDLIGSLQFFIPLFHPHLQQHQQHRQYTQTKES